MPSDDGHKQTDKELKDLEKRLTKEYQNAAKEVEEKFNGYMKDFARKDENMRKLVDSGKMSEQDYLNWRRNQLLVGERWKDMYDTLAKDLANVDQIAAGMINETLPSVYALNMNYGTYEVEKGCRIDTGFNLYSRETVENMMKNEPNIIPHLTERQKERIAKDELWNRQKLVSAVTQGVLQGESIPKVANRLQSVANMDRNAAIRNARTYTTAAQNKGRMDSYERMDKLGIQVGKKWIATLDDRTRVEHRHLDGMVVPYKDMFEVDGYEIMFPGDPSAEPEMIYNCRCTLVSEIPGIQYNDERYDEKLGDMTYEEWKHAKDRTPVEDVKEEPKQEVSWIDRIKEIQSKENLTEEDVKEAGKIIADKVHSEYLDDLRKEKDELKKEEELAKERYLRAKEKTRELNDERYKEAADIKSGWIKAENSFYFDSKESAEEYFKEIHEQLVEWQAIRSERFDEWQRLAEKVENTNPEKTADLLFGVLSQVREMGSGGIDVAGHLGNSRSPMRKIVEKAYSKYPTSWIRKSVEEGELSIKKSKRGYYSDFERVIAISGDGGNKSFRTGIHELGHRFEHTIPGILSKEKEFYDRRTEGEKLVWLGSGYGKDEKTRKDDFIDEYMGKDYGGRSYELVSMGFQHAYTDPVKLSQDEDMEQWIYGLLAVGD